MAKQVVNISTPGDGFGDPLYDAFGKVNGNFTELYNAEATSVSAAGAGNIPVATDFPRFVTDGNTLEGLDQAGMLAALGIEAGATADQTPADLGLVIGTDVAAALGADDNYVTNAELATLQTAPTDIGVAIAEAVAGEHTAAGVLVYPFSVAQTNTYVNGVYTGSSCSYDAKSWTFSITGTNLDGQVTEMTANDGSITGPWTKTLGYTGGTLTTEGAWG